MRIRSLYLILISAVVCSAWTTHALFTARQERTDQYISSFIYLPESLLKAMSLDFRGVASDYLMLKTMTYHGERLIKKRKISEKEWQSTYLAIDQITNLDPRFLDPYVFAETSFPWDAGMVHETNRLMLKAAEARPEDYRPYFFMWFNYSHFLHDLDKGSDYLQKAARSPNAPGYLATLAARQKLQVGKTEDGIIFIKEILRNTTDPSRREWLSQRLKALTTIQFIEQYIARFEKEYGRKPEALSELVEKKMLKALPPDPYGGTFYLTGEGTVYTTSKLVPVK